MHRQTVAGAALRLGINGRTCPCCKSSLVVCAQQTVPCSLCRRATGRPLVEVAHMELAEPTIEQAVARCAAAGASRVIVAPYFLSRGRHVQVGVARAGGGRRAQVGAARLLAAAQASQALHPRT